MKKIFKIKLNFIGLLVSLLFIPSLVFAAGAAEAPKQSAEAEAIDPKTFVELVNPIGGHDITGQKAGITDLTVIVGNIIKKAMGILGSLALLVFVYGGFMWVIAAGNAENVKKGTDAMQWAVIGMCIIFSSYAIIDLVLQSLGLGTNQSLNPPTPHEPGCYCSSGIETNILGDQSLNSESACTQAANGITIEGKEFDNCKWYPYPEK